MERWISFVGLFVMIGLAYALSKHRRHFPWRIVIGGLGLQILLASVLILPSQTRSNNSGLQRSTLADTEAPSTEAPSTADSSDSSIQEDRGGLYFFGLANELVTKLTGFVEAGSQFVFRVHSAPESPDESGNQVPVHRDSLLSSFAFGVLPTVVFFSCLMSILYHLGVMQWIVRGVAFFVQKTLGTSGPETLAAAANVFVGHTEAPLVVRPYIAKLTESELFAMMTGGFATVTGSLIVLYASFGAEPGHLLTACLISAPASLLVAKIIYPEVESEKTSQSLRLEIPRTSANVIGAAANGASEGLKLAFNIAAMLIAFLAIIAMLDWFVGQIGLGLCWIGDYFGFSIYGARLADGQPGWSLTNALSYLFYPLAFFMGIESGDCLNAGKILGYKMVANELVAYEQMGNLISQNAISDRTVTILTYALAGFANFSAIGIQVGGIGGLEPLRKDDVARLAFRAMLGGTLACNMTACIAGLLIA